LISVIHPQITQICFWNPRNLWIVFCLSVR